MTDSIRFLAGESELDDLRVDDLACRPYDGRANESVRDGNGRDQPESGAVQGLRVVHWRMPDR